MNNYHEFFESMQNVAKDAFQLNCQLAKAGIQDAGAFLREVHGSTKQASNMEEAIRERLQDGFRIWNEGYDSWLEWCNTLYDEDSHYNIPFNGSQRRCTMDEYKSMMGQLFQHFTMEVGVNGFDNMIIKDNWAAIRYTVKVKNLDTGAEILQHTMEFVKFKDTGDERGVRVDEGWALSDSALC